MTSGLINGVTFAVFLALVAIYRFGGGQLGRVIALAIIVNMLAAAVAAIFTPVTLDRLGFDPAVASTVFVTTVRNVVGVLSFLGLAALWLR